MHSYWGLGHETWVCGARLLKDPSDSGDRNLRLCYILADSCNWLEELYDRRYIIMMFVVV